METYCYGANEFTTWSYQASGPGTMRLFFDRGTIQSSAFDELRIHDGTNSGDPLLFVHDQTVTSNLGPIGSAINSTVGNYYVVDVFASTGQIYMELITSAARSRKLSNLGDIDLSIQVLVFEEQSED